MLYDGGGKGCGIAPTPLLKWEVRHSGVHPQIFTFEVLKPWVNMKSCV